MTCLPAASMNSADRAGNVASASSNRAAPKHFWDSLAAGERNGILCPQSDREIRTPEYNRRDLAGKASARQARQSVWAFGTREKGMRSTRRIDNLAQSGPSGEAWDEDRKHRGDSRRDPAAQGVQRQRISGRQPQYG